MRVLDLSCDIAGRFGASQFVAAGDEVLRCAPPQSLSPWLDEGKRLVDALELPGQLAGCDLVWTSFDHGQYLGHALGLAIPEGCVHVTTSSYGTTGPYAGWRGGSMADWAAGGYLFITGDPDREPLSGPERVCAFAAGYTAAAGAEAALIDRMRSGTGRHVDISTMEAMLLLHQSTFSRTASGQLRERAGRYTEVYPLTVLPCRDGHVSIGVVGDAEFDKLSIAIGRPDLTADPRFADRLLRWDNRDALDWELAGFLDQHYGEEIAELLQAGGIACAKVASPLEVARNPQLASRAFWREAPEGGVMPGDPLRTFDPFDGGGHPPLPPKRPGDLPLAGVCVLDFTIFWAGPSATRTLADLGADVIWIERPGARLDTHIAEHATPSPMELQLNLHDAKMFRGKRSIALDLQRPEDLAIAHALARQAHVVVENFRPGVAGKLGVGPAELSRINPALTYVSLSGWGADGPWADWRSYGPSIEAASSIEGRTGYIGGDPLRLGHTLPDGAGGLVGALAALRGLRRVLEGGPGGWYDISQLEAYVTLAADGIIEATRTGHDTKLVGNRSRLPGVVQGVFPCRGGDQWIAIRLEHEADRTRLAEATGIERRPLADIETAEAAIAAFTRSHDKIELAAGLQAVGIEAFAALNALELAADPHLTQRGYFVDTKTAGRSYLLPGTPFVAEPPMARPGAAPPRPGEHTEAIRDSLAALKQEMHCSSGSG